MVSTNFDPTEYVYNDTKEHKDYLDIEALLKKYKDAQNTTEITPPIKESIDADTINQSKNLLLPFNGTNLITDPTHTLFAGYIQDYYCYYYPTHSSENKADENILKGVLSLKSDGDYCKSTLEIDTNTVDDEGNINYKNILDMLRYLLL